ncbi:MAG TPA: glycosyltransferase N-terminal domain-containing protein [bacterium]|nr:glycosyltransferase N-terminal domain-containing protein [bacterium]HQG44501.1 glycosyltransferase N-terminal domain-containing protein [bacterium]HQI47796.1 glycosyltransferase N-terminal domain-containing protein [bacterium]HQJ65419.1 glycosyltransferase N-terminal domain-containing protein [bacterium]
MLIYNGIFIPLFSFIIRIASLFNRKIARGFAGRRDLLPRLRGLCAGLPPDAPRIWIHVASLGEFEQAKPIVRVLRGRLPQCRIVLSFFSPSGFEPAQKYAEADLITYLPLDSWRSTGAFLDILQPAVHLIIRHDIWPNMQHQLQRRHIPSLLVDASLTPQRLRTVRLARGVLRPVYATFAEILVTTAENVVPFRWIYPEPGKIAVSGDTRYDQVNLRALETGRIEMLRASGRFRRDRCIVAGSTWPSDERVILPALIAGLQRDPDLTLIIAPHETTEEHLHGIETTLAAAEVSFLRLAGFDPAVPFRVLLIDRVGLLANLYALGRLAFVGGGFGPGVHSVLEPAAHGCAVAFGPRHINSLEAAELKRRGGGIEITTTEEMQRLLERFLEQGETIQTSGEEALKMVRENLGASARVVDAIIRHLPAGEERNHG